MPRTPHARHLPFPAPGIHAMTPELGQLALILALLLALAQGVLPLIGAWRGNRALMAVARPAAAGQAVFVAIAFGILVWAFLHFDFSVQYVADNSNLALPWYYRIAAVWGAHEGSLLLWILILNVWTVALAAFSQKLPEVFVARVLAVHGPGRGGLPRLHHLHLRSVRPAAADARPTAATSTRCCRTRA